MRLLFILIIILTSFANSLPFSIDDASTLAQNHTEIQLGLSHGSENEYLYSIKHGLTNNADIGIYTTYGENPTATFTYVLVPNLIGTEFSTTLGTSEYTLTQMLSRTFNNFEIAGDLNENFEGGTKNHSISYGVLATYQIGPTTNGLEYVRDDNNHYKIASQILLNEWLQLNLGIVWENHWTGLSGIILKF